MLRQRINSKVVLPLTALFGALAVTTTVSQAPAESLGPLPEQFATAVNRSALPVIIVSADNVCEQAFKITGIIAAHSDNYAGAKVVNTDDGRTYCEIEVRDAHAELKDTRTMKLHPGMKIDDYTFLPITTPSVEAAFAKEREIILERFARQLVR